MNYLARFFVENYKFTVVLTLFVILFGVSGALNLKSETFPSVNIGAVVVSTRYEGASAEDIETKITRPIEKEIQRVSGVKRVKSTSQAGLSTIVTEADIDKYNVEEVISDLQRAVDRASGLPPDLKTKPIFIEIKSDELPVIEVAVVGDNKSRLRDQVADLLQEDLRDNKKVSSTILTGFTERQFNIFLSIEKLQNNHVSIAEVVSALQTRNITVPGGELKSGESQKLVRIDGKALSAKEIENIVIRSNFSGRRIILKDVARIEDGSAEPITLSSLNGQSATFITVTKKSGVDLIEAAEQIQETIAEYRKKYDGQLEFHVFNNEGTRVASRLDVLTSNGRQGIVLVFFFLLLFMPGKIGFMTAISLPLSLAATVGIMNAMNYSLNTISIIALVIAIGMLVDNAVVISENFTRLKTEGLNDKEAVLKTVRDLWAPVTATGLTTIAAFLPMLVTTGVMGQFIKGIPIIVSIALMLSLAESFFLLPARLRLVNYKVKMEGNKAKQDFFDAKVLPWFEALMTWLVDNKYKSAGIFSGVMLGTFLMLGFVNKVNLFPADQTEIYIGRVEVPKGTRVEVTKEIASEVALQVRELLKQRAEFVTAVAGESTVDNFDPKAANGSNVGLVKIFVDKETSVGVSTNEILESLRTIKNERVKSLSWEAVVNGPPVGDPLTVTFRSNDLEQLDAVVNHIQDRVSKVPGIFDAKIDDVFGDDEVNLKINFDQVARLGLSLSDIGLNVRTAIAGQTTGDVNLKNREVDYFVRFEDKDKATVSNLGQVKISDRQGNLIPLGSLAQFEVRPGSPQIKRYDFKRAKTVTANLDDSIITSIQANALVKKEFESIQDQYKEVSVVFGGEAEKTNESVASLFQALILSMIGIFALLVLIFRSYLNPFIIMTTIPLGLVGVSLSFFIHGKPLSFMALIGVIGLGGIIVNSGIILISFIDQMRAETQMSLREILIKASVLRLRAVLVTSLTTISGLIPTAYGIGGVDYFIIPMALALAWGLSTGTLFTLLWVPPAYAIVEEFTAKVKGAFGAWAK
jgi:multidrug efflux pump subunit AcrB